MKKVLLALSLLISVTAFGQDSTYNDAIRFNLTDSTEDGIVMKRKATFESLNYNQRVKQISLRFVIKFYGQNQELKFATSYFKNVTVSNKQYVVSSTGAYVGTINDVLALYGITEGNGYLKLPNGNYKLTTDCMGYYDYLVKGFDTNQKLQSTIKAIGVAAGISGKLN